MKEEHYSLIRKAAFWACVLLFIVSSPPLLLFSLGHKFDIRTMKFTRTGTLSLKTRPDNARVYVNDQELEKTTPCILPELFPGRYTVALDREGYYLYKTFADVKPAFVTEVDVTLVPQSTGMQKIGYAFNIYKFFFIERIFGSKIIAFTDQGIFLADKEFKNLQKLASDDLGAAASRLEGIVEVDSKLLFWGATAVWEIDLSHLHENMEAKVIMLYQAKKSLKNVFLGIKGSYIIVQDGIEVTAFDVNNSTVTFPITRLKNPGAEVFYDAASETLYVKDRVAEENSFSIFRIELFPSLFEKLKK